LYSDAAKKEKKKLKVKTSSEEINGPNDFVKQLGVGLKQGVKGGVIYRL